MARLLAPLALLLALVVAAACSEGRGASDRVERERAPLAPLGAPVRVARTAKEPADRPERAALASEPREPEEAPRALLVRLVAAAPAPGEDLGELVDVELWEREPRHLLEPARARSDDPPSLDADAERVPAGLRFAELPPGPLWVSASATCWETDTDAVAPVYRRVPESSGELSLELPVRCAAWVRGHVVGWPGADWELRWEELDVLREGDCGARPSALDGGDEFDELFEPAEEAGAFELWPAPPGPLTLALFVREDGRALRCRDTVRVPAAGALELGELAAERAPTALAGRVRASGEPAVAWLELIDERGRAHGFATDDEGGFRVDGELDGLRRLRVLPPDPHTHAPLELELPLPAFVELELEARAAPLVDLVLSPRDESGRYVSGAMVALVGEGAQRVARAGANHDGWCGGGVFTLPLAPSGPQPFLAWIPTRGLFGLGELRIEPVAPDEPEGASSWGGKRVLRLPLRPARGAVRGRIDPPARGAGACELPARPVVILRGDPRAEIDLERLGAGPFELTGLPTDVDLRLELRDRADRPLAAFDLRLAPGAPLDLGPIQVGRERDPERESGS